MDSRELYEKIKELGVFDEKYKTKAVYQLNVSADTDDERHILDICAFGFINHGKKYELTEYSIISSDVINTVYEFNEVKDFSNYTDNYFTIVSILNDSLQKPEDRIREFCNVTICDNYNSDYVYDEDIILSDLVILSKERIIDDRTYYGFYSTFYGKYIEKDEYEKFLGQYSEKRNLMSEMIERIQNKEFAINTHIVKNILEDISDKKYNYWGHNNGQVEIEER